VSIRFFEEFFPFENGRMEGWRRFGEIGKFNVA
jgi:hypothetical protein